MKENNIRKIVREEYSKIATNRRGCGCNSASPCCDAPDTAEWISKNIGYSEEELASIPEGANLGLGCGNPVALASLKEGETVLDLGSGAGLDCFLAANKVGEKGRVIGVDMTPTMIDKARENARDSSYKNVEFRLGEIEHLPVANETVDVVISNCVINLSQDKKQVFQEAYRVLKTNGRLIVSDIVLLRELPEEIKNNVKAYIGCLAGAIMKEDYLKTIKEARFKEINILEETTFPLQYASNDPTVKAIMNKSKTSTTELNTLTNSIASIKISAIRK